MRVIYSPRATRDLETIAAYYRDAADPKIAAAIAERIELVLRYPYKIFYRVRADVVEILHIRHTARRPWNES